MSWIVVLLVIFVLMLVSSFLHFEHKFHIVKTVLLILIVLLVFGSALVWFTSDGKDLNSPKGIVNSMFMYLTWLGDTGAKIFEVGRDSFSTIGNVVKMNNSEKKNFDGRN